HDWSCPDMITVVIQPLQRDAAVPLYRQLKQRLLEDIRGGELEPHARLASERTLLEQFGVSRITVRQALQELVQEGYLYSAPGKGFFVAARAEPYELHALRSFTATARARGHVPGSRVVAARVVPAAAEVARPLHLPEGAEVVSLVRVRAL